MSSDTDLDTELSRIEREMDEAYRADDLVAIARLGRIEQALLHRKYLREAEWMKERAARALKTSEEIPHISPEAANEFRTLLVKHKLRFAVKELTWAVSIAGLQVNVTNIDGGYGWLLSHYAPTFEAELEDFARKWTTEQVKGQVEG